MRKLVRLYDALDGELKLRVSRAAVDGQEVEHDTTDSVVTLYDAFPDSRKSVTLELNALYHGAEAPGTVREMYFEAVVECPRTRLRKRIELHSLDEEPEYYGTLELPTDEIAEKLSIVSRILGTVEGKRRIVAQSERIDVRLAKHDPPGGQGFVETVYCSFQNEDAIYPEYKNGAFHVSFKNPEQPVVYINSDIDSGFESFLEIETGQTQYAKAARLSQSLLRGAIGGALSSHIVAMLAQASSMGEDQEPAEIMPKWVFDVVDWLSRRNRIKAVIPGYNDDDRITLLARELTKNPGPVSTLIHAETGVLWKYQVEIGQHFPSLQTSLSGGSN